MTIDELPPDLKAEVDAMSPERRAEIERLTPEQLEWLVNDERKWRRAHAIAARENVDVSGVYHVLRNLEKTPGERLAAGLRHGRLRQVTPR